MEKKPTNDDGPKVYGEVCLRKQRRKRQKLLISELLYEYFKNSTVHGLRYIVDRNLYLIEKLFWLLTFLLSVGMCFYLISNVWIKWRDSPVIVSFSERVVPVGDVPFPSITICPQLKVKASVLNFSYFYQKYSEGTISNETAQRLDNLALVCGKYAYPVSIDREYGDSDVIGDLFDAAPNVSDVFWHCFWRGKRIDCDQVFKSVLTREGVCYNFNAMAASEILHEKNVQSEYPYLTTNRWNVHWSILGGYTDFKEQETYPRRGRENNADPDLSVILQESLGESDGLCNNLRSGYTIYVQHPADLPQSKLYYYAALPGQVSSLALKFKMLITDKKLEEYPAETRQCYFPYEKKLQYFRIYTPNNCRLECESKYTFKRCGCVWFHMPHDSRKICTSYESMRCVEKAYDELSLAEISTKTKMVRAQPCGCLPSCVAVEYDAEILKTDFNFQKFLKGLENVYNTKLEGNITSNLYSRVDVYFKEPRFMSMRRSELFGINDFMANCGGLLGLFCGFSFLSLVEIIYFITLRVFVILRRDLEQENVGSLEKKDNSTDVDKF